METFAGDGIRQVHGQRVDPTQRISLFGHAGEGLGAHIRSGGGIAGGFVSAQIQVGWGWDPMVYTSCGTMITRSSTAGAAERQPGAEHRDDELDRGGPDASG